MKNRSKLNNLSALISEVEALDGKGSLAPSVPVRGAVFIDMANLKWIKVAQVRPNGGYVYLAVGPHGGSDVSMGPAAVKESFIDRVGEDLLYFPPGREANAAKALISRLSKAAGSF
jgi:hypothetical protein